MPESTGSLYINFGTPELNFGYQGGMQTAKIVIGNSTSWSLNSPFAWEMSSEDEVGNEVTIYPEFKVPANNSSIPATVNVPVQAFQEGAFLEKKLPITIAKNPTSSMSSTVLPLRSSPEVLESGSTRVVIPVYCNSSWGSQYFRATVDSDWATVEGINYVQESYGTYIAYVTFSLKPNPTEEDRTATATFVNRESGQDVQGRAEWVFTQPASGDVLILDTLNPYLISPVSGAVPALNLRFPAYFEDKLPGGTLDFTVSQSVPYFHLSSAVEGYTYDGNFVTASIYTRWSQNFDPITRVGSLTFNLMRGGNVTATKTWQVYQPPFISNPTASVTTDTYQAASTDTQVIMEVDYYMGSNGSEIQEPTLRLTNFPGFQLIGSNSVNTGNVLTRKIYYTASFPVNTSEDTLEAKVDFSITSGSHTSTATVTVYQDSAQGVEGYVTVNPLSQNVPEQGGNPVFEVTYGGISAWTVNTPVCSLPFTETVLGQDSYARSSSFNITVPLNASPSPRNYYATFSISSGSRTETGVATIVQAGRTTTSSIEILTDNPINTEGGVLPIQVRYTNAFSPASASAWVASGDTVIELFDSPIYSSDGPDFTATYTATITAENTPVTGSIVFRVYNGNTVETSETLYIQIAPQEEEEPKVPTVALVESPVYVNAGDSEASFQVDYYLPNNSRPTSPSWTYSSSGTVSWNGNPTIISTSEDTYRYTYRANIGTNEEYDTRRIEAVFGVTSGSYTAEATGVILQGPNSPEPVSITVPSPVTVPASQTSLDIDVVYQGVATGVNIMTQILTNNALSSTAISQSDEGTTAYRKYRITLNPNTLDTPVTSSVVYRLNNNGTLLEETFYIYQDPSGRGFYIRCPESMSVSSGAQTGIVLGTVYYGGVSSSDQLYPEYTASPSQIARINVLSEGLQDGEYYRQYGIAVDANTTSNPINSYIWWGIRNLDSTGVAVSASTVVVQAPLLNPRVIVSPANLVVSGTVTSSNIAVTYSQYTAGYSTNEPSCSEGVTYNIESTAGQDNDLYRRYLVRYPTASVNTTRTITFSMTSGSVTKSATTVIQQRGTTPSQNPKVTVNPSNLEVAATVTSCNLMVTYSQYTGYSIGNPVCSQGVTYTLVSSTTQGSNLFRNYRINYPTSSADIIRSITFSMTSGSDTKSATATIRQQGTGPSQRGITLSTTLASVPYYQTSFYVTADYYGISSTSAIPPLNSVEGNWTATMDSAQEETNHVKVVWHLQGDVNETGRVVRSTFIFRATGIDTTATLVLNQQAFEEGSVVDSGIIPAWKDTNTNVGTGTSWDVVCRSSSLVLFSEKMYSAPDKNYLEVNFNRLAESYLEPREFPTTLVATPLFFFQTTFRDANSEFSYEYRVVDDWSYDSDNNVTTEYVLSRPYQKELVVGQYLVYSFLRTNSTSNDYIQILANGRQIVSSTPVLNNYYDFSRRVTECGVWQIKQGLAGPILERWNTVDAKYVLYYYNKYAGWDSFVIKGPVVPSVDIARNNYINFRRNSRTYQNNVVEKFKVNTGVLTDTVSPVVSELASSPRLVLHDIVQDKLVPVKVTTNSVERKTFWNQGRQFATYQFDLESDLTQIRR